jgi:BirA family biotin operon repressor/biotin-[acetyl-CoA-carboxylase] ligase
MPNLRLLRYLYTLQDRWVLPQAMTGDLGLPTESIHRDVERLLRDGYAIEYHPSYGYRFRPQEHHLDPQALEDGLEVTLVGREIHSLAETTSTMDVAWSLLEEGAPSGTVVVASAQRKGRGRFRRGWISPRGGGVWMSVLLRKGDVPDPTFLLTVSSAIAVAEAIEETTDLAPRIRWPNDIVLGGRKVGGILTEMRQEGGGLLGAVLGLGINVRLDASELPDDLRDVASSLFREGARRVDRASLTRALIRSLDTWCRRTLEGEREDLGRRWRDLSSSLGRRAILTQGDGRFEGVVVDLDPIGGLSIDLGGGDIRTFAPERVSLLEV